jgi:hypothetical protein
MRAAILLSALAASAVAQTGGFSYAYQTSPATPLIPVSVSGTVAFPSIAPGTTTTFAFHIRSHEDSSWRLAEVNLSGAGFTLSGAGDLVVPALGSVFFSLHYSPLPFGRANALLALRLLGPSGQAVVATFNLSGPAAGGGATTESTDVVVSYVFYNTGNQTALRTGETIPFPPTGTGVRNTVAVVITNRATSATSVTSVSVTGTGFEATGIPLLPATIVGGGETRFTIHFTPPEAGEYTGQLQLTVGGSQRAFVLRGQGAAPSFSLELLSSEPPVALAPGSTVAFPVTAAVTGRATLRFQLRNTGNAEGRIGSLTVSGNAFQLVDPPVPPITLRPGETQPFAITFAPREVGEHSGQLRADIFHFTLSGRATGARIVTSLVFGEIKVPLRANVPAVVPNTEVGGRRTFAIEASNLGDEAGYVVAATVDGDGFSLTRSNVFPLTVAPGESIRIEAQFAPTQVGTVTGSLVVHDQSYQLIGVGSEPPPLGRASFTGLPPRVDALQQPAVGLELSDPYPYDVTGRLSLRFQSESFLEDPAVQFVTGSRTVDFRIPANTTKAIFGSALREIRFQTGSIAGAITLVAQINVARVDLTRNTPPVATVDIPPGPPIVRGLQFVARSSRLFDLVINGASTARSVSRFQFQFTPAPGVRLQSDTISLDVASRFDAWYRSANSHPYGSQFSAVITFELSADLSSIEALTVRAINGLGTSAPRTVSTTGEK